MRGSLAASIEAAGKKHPNDLSIAIAEALLALASKGATPIEPALKRLDQLVEKTPLEPLPPGVKANARQRTEAARQVPLWLVARACWKHKGPIDPPGFADKLAARAQEAAARQTDNQALMAMLREQGELALERGDRHLAEAAWGRMLTLVVELPESKLKQPSRARAKPSRPPRHRGSPRPPLDASWNRTRGRLAVPPRPLAGGVRGRGAAPPRRPSQPDPPRGTGGVGSERAPTSATALHAAHLVVGRQGRGQRSRASQPRRPQPPGALLPPFKGGVRGGRQGEHHLGDRTHPVGRLHRGERLG